MELIKVEEKAKNKNKRFTAYFNKDGKTEKVEFGAKNGNTFLDHKDKTKKENYIKRHSSNPLEKPFLNKKKFANKPSNLAKGLLWNKESLKESIKDYKRKYNV